ncbi:MAG TPA: hypothetical protein VGQ41_09960 [Pyrinomonadaceae bacterium]|jgi:hypothetical protein|nr:hypothetical protein [Pyrinomonadaceae bacterium]
MERVSSNAIASSLAERSIGNLLLRRRFLVSLLLGTWLPIAFFTLIAPPIGASGGLASLKAVFLFLGTAHVPATLFFYADKDFSSVRKSHPVRYIYVPLFLILVSGAVFTFASVTIQAFTLLIYWAWQAFHYGRQNVGMYAFASIAETGRAPRRAEKLVIDGATLLAILGTFKVMGTAVAPAYLRVSFDYLYQIGFLSFIALTVFSVAVYFKYFQETSLFKTLFFFTAIFFFAPVFISTDNNVGFLSYAIAHGVQYIIFMSVISVRAGDDKPGPALYKSLTLFLIFVVLLGFVFWRVNDLREIEFVKSTWAYARIADFLFGAVLGATMSHFVIDASAWRLSMAKQRSYITKRFNFVFD